LGSSGYYFAGRTETGIIDLFADEPFFEGKAKISTPHDSDRVVAEMIEIVRERGAGIYRYDLLKPAFPDQVFSNISFVKYFEPFDWFLGAGIYDNEMAAVNQEAVLDHIRQVSFGRGGEMFAFTMDGTIISHSNTQLIGRSIDSLVDNDALHIGQQLFETGSTGPQEGFVVYKDFLSGDPQQQKLCFVKAYKDWDWVIGAAISMNEMEELIVGATETYPQNFF
jgi:signal transduction histidine kinase